MPELMALHDAYHDRGLVVIGVHDDSVADIDEMKSKLEPIRRRLWSGRQIPFPVALDGGGGEKSEASHGTTTAEYGIRSFPTAVLIDRQGHLVSKFYASSDASIKRLQELVGIAGDDRLQEELGIASDGKPFVPTWRHGFDGAYRLEPGQHVKRVAPPFIPQRDPFLTHLTIYGGSRPDTERLTIVQTDSEPLTGTAGGADLRSILRSLMPFGMPDDACKCSAELVKLKLPGDWVFREEASLDERFAALAKILREELNLDLEIERREVARDAIVVTGGYDFHPLPALRPRRASASPPMRATTPARRGAAKASSRTFSAG
jgi:hypothetical protein